jgi:hypothetical protein
MDRVAAADGRIGTTTAHSFQERPCHDRPRRFNVSWLLVGLGLPLASGIEVAGLTWLLFATVVLLHDAFRGQLAAVFVSALGVLRLVIAGSHREPLQRSAGALSALLLLHAAAAQFLGHSFLVFVICAVLFGRSLRPRPRRHLRLRRSFAR